MHVCMYIHTHMFITMCGGVCVGVKLERIFYSNLMDFKRWSNTKGVVTVAIDNNARQPSSISLNKTTMRLHPKQKKAQLLNAKWR